MNARIGEVSVIRAGLAHLDALVPLFEAYRAFYRQPPDAGRARTFLRDRLVRDESVVFLAESRSGSGAAVFVGFTQLYPLFSSTAMERLWLLNDLFVAPAARGQDVARRLMLQAERHARETRATGLMLQTAIDNAAAQRLYESVGYERDTHFYVYNRDL
jgi:ribosomal protein S18 acetylase RimI-like enzyme